MTRAAAALALSALTACGALTGLPLSDASVDAAGRDAGPDLPPPCVEGRACDDSVPCTTDRCTPAGCTHDGVDARCDDHLFCNGTEVCSPIGCVAGAPLCFDGVACTEDRCDEAMRACTFDPNPRLCPLSNRCDAVRGCEPAVYAVDDTRLYAIELPSGALYPIVPTETVLTDLALAADGAFYGASRRGLVRVDERTGATTLVLPVMGHFVALEADPATGAIFGGTSDTLMQFDLASGTTTVVAHLPPGIQASGDIAFLHSVLLMTTTSDGGAGAPDDLYGLPHGSGAGLVRIGNIGFPCVWGLAVYHDALYGLTCHGDVLSIDPTTGVGTSIANDGVRFGGAAAR